MTLKDVTTKVDTALETLWPTIIERQTAYSENHGEYFQGLSTHQNVPSDGRTLPPDRLAISPTDRSATWEHFGLHGGILRAMPMALRVDTYNGPLGKGFVATCSVSIAGKLYERSDNYGPESWRLNPWQEVTPLPMGPSSSNPEGSAGFNWKPLAIPAAIGAGIAGLIGAGMQGPAVDIVRGLLGWP